MTYGRTDGLVNMDSTPNELSTSLGSGIWNSVRDARVGVAIGIAFFGITVIWYLKGNELEYSNESVTETEGSKTTKKQSFKIKPHESRNQ